MSRLPELLAPAGSPEGVAAAIQNGADAVYLGGTAFNARRRAKNFTEESLEACVRACHLYGVRVYATFNILVGDREFSEAARQLRLLGALGVDALIIQDLGAAALAREICPGLPLHASTQMALHDVPGAFAAQKLGFTRAVVARELRGEDLRTLCRESPIAIEAFVHGALCGAVSGQCYMSALIGQRSGNRGLCAQPCRMSYAVEDVSPSGDAAAPVMSLKDLCMASHLQELAQMGVACLKIEGRMRRPEYTGLVTGVYRRALDRGDCPTRAETEQLRLMFSRDGFTDGYFTGKTVKKERPADLSMYGVKEDPPETELEALCAVQRRIYEQECPRKVGVDCTLTVKAGQPMVLTVTDGTHTVRAAGSEPEAAKTAATGPERMEQNLRKWGGTAFAAQHVAVTAEEGLAVPMAAVNALRRDCAAQLKALRETLPKDAPSAPPVTDALTESFSLRRAPAQNAVSAPSLTVGAETLAQALAVPEAERTYLPLEVCAAENGWEALRETVAVLPRIIHPREAAEIRDLLDKFRKKGGKAVSAGNLGHAYAALQDGWTVCGDFGLNVYNSAGARTLAAMGISCLTASFELQWAAVRDLEKAVPMEAIVYGRLPLMIFENCLIRARLGRCGCEKPRWLRDRTGQRFLLLKGFGCRTRLFNGAPLYLADRREDYAKLGLRYARLLFTTETPAECASVYQAYLHGGETPGAFTRGLYYRGVE